jgi:hypothetical protein
MADDEGVLFQAGLWRETAWGKAHLSDAPAFRRAENVGWSGYMFGGVMDLDGFKGRSDVDGVLDLDDDVVVVPKVIPVPMKLSDVWHFEMMMCRYNETTDQCANSSHELGFGVPGIVNVMWTYMAPPDERTGSCDFACQHVDNAATVNGAKSTWSTELGAATPRGDAAKAWVAAQELLGTPLRRRNSSPTSGTSWPGARYRHAAWVVDTRTELG